MTSEIAVVGGGLAGAAAGCILAAAGRDVTIIDREAGPIHKICGEFLSIEAQAYLHKIGFDVKALGGHPISRLRLFRGHEFVETDLPFIGIGLSRRALDEAMLHHAVNRGAKLLRGRAVTGISDNANVHLADGEVLKPETVFLATGKHDVRGLRRRSSVPESLVGFKMHFRLQPSATERLEHFISLILFRDGYAGLQLIENEQANLCLLVKRERLQRCGKWSDLLGDLCEESAYLAGVLDGATPLIPQPLTIYRVPYGYVHRSDVDESHNVYRLGDQAAVIPSFTGDGMAIALHSALLSSSALLRGDSAEAYHTQLAKDVSAQIQRAGILYELATHRWTRRVFFQIVRLLPGILSIGANLTRVSERSRFIDFARVNDEGNSYFFEKK